MAETYRLTPLRRLGNALMKPLTRLGLGGRHTYLLTVRPYFDVTPDSPPAAFEAEAPRHPVFRLNPSSGG